MFSKHRDLSVIVICVTSTFMLMWYNMVNKHRTLKSFLLYMKIILEISYHLWMLIARHVRTGFLRLFLLYSMFYSCVFTITSWTWFQDYKWISPSHTILFNGLQKMLGHLKKRSREREGGGREREKDCDRINVLCAESRNDSQASRRWQTGELLF